MKEKIVGKLMSGKYFLTVTIGATACYLAITGAISGEQFMMLATSVISGYFIQSAAKRGV